IIYYFFDDANSERLMSVMIRTEGKYNQNYTLDKLK
ncbi:unnamed protein product, partial [marine sediment metagenome]